MNSEERCRERGEPIEHQRFCSGCGVGPLCEACFSVHEIVTGQQRASEAEEKDAT